MTANQRNRVLRHTGSPDVSLSRLSEGRSQPCLQEASSSHNGKVRHRGYTRVSSSGQDAQLQLDAHLAAGVRKRNSFADVTASSRAPIERPCMKKLLDYAGPGDTVVVCRVDRLGLTTTTTLSSGRSSGSVRNNQRPCELKVFAVYELDGLCSDQNCQGGHKLVKHRLEKQI